MFGKLFHYRYEKIKTSILLIVILSIISTLLCSFNPILENNRLAQGQAFDFWIGNWNINQKILTADGSYLRFPARTSVSPALDSLALVEHWEGQVQFFWEGMKKPENIKGLSVRAYDPKTQKWYIHWMDTRSPYFNTPYAGTFSGNTGVFYRDWDTTNGPRTGRITFTHVSTDSVNWSLAVSHDNRKNWTILWIMNMQRTAK